MHSHIVIFAYSYIRMHSHIVIIRMYSHIITFAYSAHSIILTFFILAVYCFIAIFSTTLSNPKNALICKLASCSKQVQFGFSGCTWNAKVYLRILKKEKMSSCLMFCYIIQIYNTNNMSIFKSVHFTIF